MYETVYDFGVLEANCQKKKIIIVCNSKLYFVAVHKMFLKRLREILN